jgi:hypothetical protein
VYSNLVDEPTLSDNKKEAAETDGVFTVTLEGLNSGTVYHARAYATNSKGTAYGAVVNFTTGNAVPTAINLSVSGTVEANKEVTAEYTYSDPEDDPEAVSTFQWYVADNISGSGEAAIEGATAKTFLIQDAQQGKYIRFGVTPKATAGSMNGAAVKSSFAGAVGEPTTVTFTYNNTAVTYGIITSAKTQRKWLDRNLGAPAIATTVNDFANYGDLFQWGRRADGHQLISRTSADAATGVNGTTSLTAPYEYADTDQPLHNKFIIVVSSGGNAEVFDWRKPQNNALWQGVNGTNNPCPTGWRIATKAEWDAENLSNIGDAFGKLKLTLTGIHDGGDGEFYLFDRGYYWTSTWATPAIDGATINGSSFAIRLRSDLYTPLTFTRSTGGAVRCIKDNT